uniref:BMERB domain-containing protein n=1 Tax=Macrostomum lignano TaxID=282301 RepID=A0A1I8F299_9PLAT
MDPADMVMKTIPDQLLVMTFLHQLRAHFTNQEIRLVSRLASSESSYTLAQPDEDKDADHSDGNGDNTDHTDEAKKLQTTAKQVDQASGQVVKQQQQQQMPKSKTDSAGLSTATPAALPTSSSAGRGFKELRRERDRDLATRAAKEIRLLSSYNTDGTVRDQVSAGSTVRQSGANFQLKSDAKSAAKSGAASLKKADEERKRGFSGDEEKTVEDAEDEDNDEDAARPSSTVLSNFNRVLDTSAYVASERLALEAEQSDIDSQAEVLEKRLRGVLCGSSGSKDEEQPLLTQWFQLVNKKNALIRRARQLDMLDQEQDLEKRYRMLELELRGVMSVEDWQKTDEERRREDLLLRDLMDIVRKRDEVVREMDLHEREIVKDLDIERKAMERLNRGSGAGSGRTCSITLAKVWKRMFCFTKLVKFSIMYSTSGMSVNARVLCRSGLLLATGAGGCGGGGWGPRVRSSDSSELTLISCFCRVRLRQHFSFASFCAGSCRPRRGSGSGGLQLRAQFANSRLRSQAASLGFGEFGARSRSTSSTEVDWLALSSARAASRSASAASSWRLSRPSASSRASRPAAARQSPAGGRLGPGSPPPGTGPPHPGNRRPSQNSNLKLGLKLALLSVQPVLKLFGSRFQLVRLLRLQLLNLAGQPRLQLAPLISALARQALRLLTTGAQLLSQSSRLRAARFHLLAESLLASQPTVQTLLQGADFRLASGPGRVLGKRNSKFRINNLGRSLEGGGKNYGAPWLKPLVQGGGVAQRSSAGSGVPATQTRFQVQSH